MDRDVVEALELDGTESEPLLGGRVSRLWRTARHGRPVAVRRSPWFRAIEEVAFECEVLDLLEAAGAPVAPAVAGPVEVAGAVWTAFAWAEGAHPRVPVADPERYGELLAELHSAAATLVPGREQRPGWRRVDEFFTRPRSDGEVTFEAVLPDFERATGDAGRVLGRFAPQVHDRLCAAEVAVLPHVVAHGDFGPHQILVHQDGAVSAVVDWDFTHLDLALADVAIATSLARPTADRAAAMLRAYLATSSIEIGDLSLLGDLRRAFHLNNLANQVCALWVNGLDIERSLVTITERLNREQWWAPTLLAAARRSTSFAEVPAPRSVVDADSSDLDVAHELADRAAIVAGHYFSEGVVAESKPDATPVTEADRAVERLLLEGLSALRPSDAVLGEEFGRRGSAERTWILDPIDGTAAFAAGDPNWRIQIALQTGERIVIAVVDAPALGVRWWAEAAGGAHERTAHGVRRLEVSSTADPQDAKVAVHPADAAGRLPEAVVPTARTPLPLIELVRGEIDAFYVDCCQVWDHAPWILLVLESGGAFTDNAGTQAGDQRGGLYSNAPAHGGLLDSLRPPITRLGWLDAPTPAAVRDALGESRADLAGRMIDVPPDRTGGAPLWRRACASVGDDHFVKFAWSMPAARKLWHEAQVTRFLGQVQPPLPVAHVEDALPHPVLLVARRLRGAPIWHPEVSAMSSSARRDLARQLASFLQRLHAPGTLAAAEDAMGPLPAPVPQATTDAIRHRLGPFIGEDRTALVARWCDWIDAIQTEPADRALLHGDFGGHNLLWDDQVNELAGVVDFEEAAAGDPNYDLRYLPSQAATLELLHDVAEEYRAAGGHGYDLRRVMAWSLRTVLGDALWRSEAGVALPYGGRPHEWVDEMEERLHEANVLD